MREREIMHEGALTLFASFTSLYDQYRTNTVHEQ